MSQISNRTIVTCIVPCRQAQEGQRSRSSPDQMSQHTESSTTIRLLSVGAPVAADYFYSATRKSLRSQLDGWPGADGWEQLHLQCCGSIISRCSSPATQQVKIKQAAQQQQFTGTGIAEAAVSVTPVRSAQLLLLPGHALAYGFRKLQPCLGAAYWVAPHRKPQSIGFGYQGERDLTNCSNAAPC